VDTHREIPPSARLRRYVECYWSRSEDDAANHLVLPDGCVDILFSRSGGEPLGLATVGLMTTAISVPAAPARSFFGVRFRPGMASAFLPGAERLTDETRPLEDLAGSAARRMFERLAELHSLEAMAGLMDQLLRPLDPPDVGERVLWQIESAEFSAASSAPSSAPSSLDQLIAQSGLSVRHFRRVCLERAGVSPKYLSRILRFRKAAQRIAAVRVSAQGSLAQPRWADFAVACGYYDQAHFIREFQEFAGCTPGRFLQSRKRDGSAV
jgi:AraC-like DNA-binding protein